MQHYLVQVSKTTLILTCTNYNASKRLPVPHKTKKIFPYCQFSMACEHFNSDDMERVNTTKSRCSFESPISVK